LYIDKTRPRLLAAGWILLALSLFLGIVAPRLTASNIPRDIGNNIGDLDWISLGWTIVAMIVGALALMCFVAQWVLRPRRTGSAHPPGNPPSK
jgi:TRAP-type C4-dicarboxylate transport system permease small subunit